MNQPPFSTSLPKTSALAIWSLVLGILSLVCFTIFTGIPGVICGHKALSRIKRSGGALGGQGMAIAGLITGYLGIALAFVMIPVMLAIIIPNFAKARKIALQNACINQLRQIDSAKRQWELEKPRQPTEQPGAEDLKTYLEEGMPTCPAHGDYQINSIGKLPTCSIPGHALDE